MSVWTRNEYVLSDEPKRLDLDKVHKWLNQSDRAKDLPRSTLERAIRFSLCFGVYKGPIQVAFARVISDFATFAYLSDLYVVEEHRHQGLAQWLMETIGGHTALQGLRRWILITQDAHALYERHGFHPLSHAEHYMEK